MTTKKNLPKKKRKPSVLVVGGGAFVGIKLCDALISQNLEVFWVDNIVDRKSAALLSRQKAFNFHFVNGDVSKSDFKSPTIPQYIFHLAGVEEYLDGKELQLNTLLINSKGTEKLLELAKEHQSRFLLISSVDIYSSYLSYFDLDHYFGTGKDASKYSHHEAKRYAEALTFGYHQNFDVDARVVRLADVYGPGMNLDSPNLLNRLFHQASFYEPLIIAGDGLTPVRPTYVGDVVYGVAKAMFNPNTSGKIYTLINPEEVTILNLAYLIREECRNEIQVMFLEEKELSKRYVIDRDVLAKTESDLGWRPKVSLREGVKKTLAWIRDRGQETEEPEVGPVESDDEELVPDKKDYEDIDQEELLLHHQETKSDQSSPDQKDQQGEVKEEEEVVAGPPPPTEEKEAPPKLKIKSSAPIGIRGAKPKTKKSLGLKLPSVSLPKPRFNIVLPRPQRPNLGRPSRRMTTFFISLFVLLGLVVTPPVVYAGSGVLAVYRVQKAIKALKTQQVQLAAKEALLAQKDIRRAAVWLDRTTWLAGMVNKRKELEQWRDLTVAIEEIARATGHVARSAPSALLMARSIVGQGDESVEENLRLVKVELDLADDNLALAEGKLKTISPEWYPSLISDRIKTLKSELTKTRTELGGVRDLLQVFPRIIGTTGQRAYLLLLQNNMELRPGGGFIGSFGLVKFINGRMVDLKIEDVYNADGQLEEVVIAPEPIKTYLKQPNWYLRDSNWSPHFPTNAAQAQWFIKNSIGEQVDGVIAFDLSFIKEILTVLGSVEITDYQEVVSADDLFEKAEYRVEKDFFPGSSQKRDFLGALARALIQKVIGSSEGAWPALMRAAGQAAGEKHLLVSFVDQDLNQLIVDREWNGAIPIEREIVSGNHFRDFLMVVDANLGANKANYFVRRSIFHQVVVDGDGNLAERVTIEYDNQSPAETWPGGVYTNYLRVYVSSGAVLQDVRIDNHTVPGEVKRGRELGKTVWALPIQVPIKSKLSVSFEYHLTQPLVFEGGLASYELKVFKQAGVTDDRLGLTFNYPSSYQILKSEPRGKAEQQAVVFSTTLEKDRTFKLEVVK